MVAVKAEQDGCPRGEANDFANIALDLDSVVGVKRLADRQHDGRDEILDRIPHGKTDGEADNPCSAQNTR